MRSNGQESEGIQRKYGRIAIRQNTKECKDVQRKYEGAQGNTQESFKIHEKYKGVHRKCKVTQGNIK
jgi:hypothetical protein